MTQSRQYVPGDVVPATGMYLVYHQGHRLHHEVLVFAGQIFPVCRKCGDAVRFVQTLAISSPEVLHPLAADSDFPWGVFALAA
jgi:hypothetical protein